MLDPVIILGVEHVLLIVKAPALSPRLSACTQSDFGEEEEEEDKKEDEEAGCSLFPVSHLVTANHKAHQADKNDRVAFTDAAAQGGAARPRDVYCLSAGGSTATDDLRIDCGFFRAAAANFQERQLVKSVKREEFLLCLMSRSHQ